MKRRSKHGGENGRLARVQRVFSVVMYVLICGCLCCPWMLIGDKRYSLWAFALQMKRDGIASLVVQAGFTTDPAYGAGAKVNLALYFVLAVLSVFYLVTVLIGRDWYLNLGALLIAVAVLYAGVTPYMLISFCGNYAEGVLYVGILLVLTGIEFIGRKIIENWDVTVREKDEYQEKEKRRKAERRRRLEFPGRYSKLFWQAVWKNFRLNLKDYAVLLLCNALVFAFVLSGFGLQKLTSAGDKSMKLGYPSGAGRILLRSILELGAVGLFMLVLLLLYYLRKRIPEYGVFMTLGIRKKTMYLTMGLELGLGALLSLVLGGVGGILIIRAFQKNLSGVEGGFLSPVLLLKAAAVMLVLYLVTFFVTHDLFVGFRMGSSTKLQMLKEWMPGKFHLAFVSAGAGLTVLMLFWYRENGNFENIQLLGGCFLGIYLVLRFGMAGYLLYKRRKASALLKLLRQQPFYHRSRSAVWYIFGLCVLQVCILAVFSVQIFSVHLVKDRDSLFPYDLVLCASAEDEQDEELLEKMKGMEGVYAAAYPMFRVSGTDATETAETRESASVRSQNIGIPESAYHALKRVLDPEYKEKPLELDADGETVYIVHQQSKGTKARPVDYKSLRSTPYLYTGPVCVYVDQFSQQSSFSRRRIVGEETACLIGDFCQGERENLVVFSDAYFEKAKDIWKVTDPFTGNVLRGEELSDFAELLYQGPTKLVTVRADQKTLGELQPELDAFQERHKKDEEYDAKVKSYYLKTDARLQMDTELNMQETMGKLLIFIFFAAGVLLLGIKMMTEKEMNIRRAQFLYCMGMRQKERKRLLRWEMGIYYVLALVISAAVSVPAVLATFHARLYGTEDIKIMMAKLLPFGAGELAALGVMVWILTEWYIWQIEGRAGEI